MTDPERARIEDDYVRALEGLEIEARHVWATAPASYLALLRCLDDVALARARLMALDYHPAATPVDILARGLRAVAMDAARYAEEEPR